MMDDNIERMREFRRAHPEYYKHWYAEAQKRNPAEPAEKIRKYRKEHKMTQEQFGRLFHVHTSQVCHWEKRRRAVPEQVIEAIGG